MTSSNIISSGSEASDNEDSSHSSTPEVIKNARNPRTRGGTRSSNARGRPSRSRRPSMSKLHTKHYVEHNYHDHARDPFVSNEQGTDEVANLGDHIDDDENAKKKRGGHRGGVAVPFPEKLHYMLSQMEQNETPDVVNWQPHGRCFIVHKPKEFVEDIMPKFFRQTKMTSFQRQLNLYGFARLTAGPDRGGYYHELFLRGRMDLCKRMVRTRVKGNGSKAASSPSTEPNFYVMKPCYEQKAISDVIIPDVEARLGSLDMDTVVTKKDEEMVTEDVSAPPPPLIEDHDDEADMLLDGVDHDAEIVLKPIYEFLEGPTGRPSRATSWSSLPIQSASTMSLPALVSPMEHHKALVSPPQTPREALFAPIVSLPSMQESLFSLDSDQASTASCCDLHSGDQVFFEGLPFHYLETKDIEDSLQVVGV